MFPQTFSKAQLQKCSSCGLIHHKKFNCRQSLCTFCSKTHRYDQYIDGTHCPTIYKMTLYSRKDTLLCPQCRGLGRYEKVQEVTISEQEESYKKRYEQWREEVKYDPDLKEPQLMQFRHSIIKAQVDCTICDKAGIVPKYKRCQCSWGCNKCDFRRVIENSVWRKVKEQLKKKDVKVGKDLVCMICTEQLPADTPTYPMQCEHLYHKQCILKWFNTQEITNSKKTCPVCRNAQEFLPRNYYEQYTRAVADKEGRSKITTRYFDDDNVIKRHRRRHQIKREEQKEEEDFNRESRSKELKRGFKPDRSPPKEETPRMKEEEVKVQGRSPSPPQSQLPTRNQNILIYEPPVYVPPQVPTAFTPRLHVNQGFLHTRRPQLARRSIPFAFMRQEQRDSSQSGDLDDHSLTSRERDRREQLANTPRQNHSD